jgi:hypothetical protein
MLLGIALLGFTGCEDTAELSGENKITAFQINDIPGSIDEANQNILITLPASTDVTHLTPVVTVSSNASVNPEPETPVNAKYPIHYTVTAENGVTRRYSVTVLTDGTPVVLDAIQIQTLPTKTVYAQGDVFSSAGLVVIGKYSDGSVQQETAYTLDPLRIPTEATGEQTVTVSVGEKTTTFTVSVRETQLESISVTVLKDTYDYNEAFDPQSIVVTGTYSDGSTRTEEEGSYTVDGYDPQTPGYQRLKVILNSKIEIFGVTVGPEPEVRTVSVTIGLPNDSAAEPALFGLPADGKIKLSTSQNNGLPASIIISAAGVDANGTSGVYSEVKWYIDGTEKNGTPHPNILTIEAKDYTLKIPHSITFVGTKEGVEYARTIDFTVER